MKRKHQRLAFVLFSLALMAFASTLLLRAFRDNLIFFYTPTQWQEHKANATAGTELRLGGLVKQGSIHTDGTGSVTFIITDLSQEVMATYRGLLPNLFREGQGVVAQGSFDDAGVLHARTILAKHDENYMPKEVVDQLKKSGRWQH